MAMQYDVEKIRKDFPVLSQKVNGHPLVYLDNAATAQKPKQVIERTQRFYEQEYATIHRGVYTMSQKATLACEDVRRQCQKFLNAKKSSEIVFVRGATEAVNLVAAAYGRKFLKQGDEVLITEIEHHANIVPWQQLCLEKDAILKVIPVNDAGELCMDVYQEMLSKKTKIVAIGHMSNALGTIHPVKEITRMAHDIGAMVFIDGAQGAAHMRVDVQDMDCDFYCFSGHKLYGPTGIGVLYGKAFLLDQMDPYQTGGEMIESVEFEKTTFAKRPLKFEAGTPAIAQIIGLGAALEYLAKLGLDAVGEHESHLLKEATAQLSDVPGVKLIGTAKQKGAVISFVFDGVHPHDIGTILDQEGIAVRTGHHCAQPTMKRFGIPATVRASFGLYNTLDEVPILVKGLHKVREVFQ